MHRGRSGLSRDTPNVAVELQNVKLEGGEEEGQVAGAAHSRGFHKAWAFPTSQQDRLHLPVLPLLHTSGSEPRESRNRLEGAGARREGAVCSSSNVRSGASGGGEAGPARAGRRRSLEGAAASGRSRMLLCAEGSRHQGEPKAAASSLAGSAVRA